MNRLLHSFLIHQVPLSGGILLPDTVNLTEAVQAMRLNKTGCVVTTQKENVTGIFTERDLLLRIVGESVDWNAPISSFATQNPITMTEKEPLRKALFQMRKKGIRHIPIFSEQGEFRGVLSIRNVIRLMAEHFPTEIMNLPPRIHAAASTREGG